MARSAVSMGFGASCKKTLVPGATVMKLLKAADERLQNLIPEVFEELGYLRPLYLLLPDGRPWQAVECQIVDLVKMVSAGYPTK